MNPQQCVKRRKSAFYLHKDHPSALKLIYAYAYLFNSFSPNKQEAIHLSKVPRLVSHRHRHRRAPKVATPRVRKVATPKVERTLKLKPPTPQAIPLNNNSTLKLRLRFNFKRFIYFMTELLYFLLILLLLQ